MGVVVVCVLVVGIERAEGPVEPAVALRCKVQFLREGLVTNLPEREIDRRGRGIIVEALIHPVLAILRVGGEGGEAQVELALQADGVLLAACVARVVEGTPLWAVIGNDRGEMGRGSGRERM